MTVAAGSCAEHVAPFCRVLTPERIRHGGDGSVARCLELLGLILIDPARHCAAPPRGVPTSNALRPAEPIGVLSMRLSNSFPHPARRRSALACAILLCCASGTVQAQQSGSEPEQDTTTRKPRTGGQSAATLDTLLVRARRDQIGQDTVYSSDVSNLYVGKEEVERYKTTSVGDLFKGLNGVYSGDSRNAGALDPNIRGIQGEGRVPVTVDGTEQAMSIWQGPSGVANRNYLDPNLVSSIAVEKGPSLTPGVKSGIGGAVTIRTLEVDDVVRPGERWGLEMKGDTATNSVAPRDNATRLFGMDYRDIPGAYNAGYSLGIEPNGENSTVIKAKSAPGASNFNLEDRAFRIAAGYKGDWLEVMAAFSDRRQGNYASGSNGSEDFQKEGNWWEGADTGSAGARYTRYMANLFQPSHEVTNTSSDMRSTLIKATVHLPAQQSLRLNLMRNRLEFGESVPFQTLTQVIAPARDRADDEPYQVQGPASLVKQDTYGLTYGWKPDALPWVDFKAGVWTTRNDSYRHQNGSGYLGIRSTRTQGQPAWDDYVQCHVVSDNGNKLSDERCALVPSTPPEKMANTDGRFTIFPQSLQIANHDRNGFNLSNRFAVNERLNFTVAGDFQRETLDGYDKADELFVDQYNWGSFHFGPRAGRRREYNGSVNFEWAPSERLVITAGARYGNYWSYDDGTARHRQGQHANWENGASVVARSLGYYRLMSDAENQAYIDAYQSWVTPELREEFLEFMSAEEIDAMEAESLESYLAQEVYKGLRYVREQVIVPYADGRMDSSRNPMLNGGIDMTATVTDPQGQTGTRYQYLPCVAEICKNFGEGNFLPSAGLIYGETPADVWALPERKKASDWAPMFGLTWFFSDRARVYARYVESIRFPSLYEATQAGYGAGWGAPTGAALTPERARNWELGYVHDLGGLLPGLRQADIRLNYYNNTINDAIDRNFSYEIMQFERKIMTGLELQARADAGHWFASFGASYRLKNEVCDGEYAKTLDPYFGTRFASCVTAGFPNTFMRTSLQPQYSLNLDVGMRLLDGRLQFGGRSIYHASAKNEDEAKWIAAGYDEVNRYDSPFEWKPVMVFDAYANYRFSQTLAMDFSITNIGNRYYLDPLARVTLPAPGRTLRVGVTVGF